MHDPRAVGTRPSALPKDLTRLLGALDVPAAATEGSLDLAHEVFGKMPTRDWQRWAYRHTDYHLRQFGL
jgi:hypothetical protein